MFDRGFLAGPAGARQGRTSRERNPSQSLYTVVTRPSVAAKYPPTPTSPRLSDFPRPWPVTTQEPTLLPLLGAVPRPRRSPGARGGSCSWVDHCSNRSRAQRANHGQSLPPTEDRPTKKTERRQPPRAPTWARVRGRSGRAPAPTRFLPGLVDLAAREKHRRAVIRQQQRKRLQFLFPPSPRSCSDPHQPAFPLRPAVRPRSIHNY